MPAMRIVPALDELKDGDRCFSCKRVFKTVLTTKAPLPVGFYAVVGSAAG